MTNVSQLVRITDDVVEWYQEKYMSIRSLGYDNDNLDSIICYYMRTILHLQNTGIENLPLENDFEEPYKTYNEIAMRMITDGQPREISQLILDAEYDAVMTRGNLTAQAALSLRLIRELSWHIHYDEDYYGYLLSTGNLWGNMVLEYASYTFYPNLPTEIQEKYQITDFIKHIPQEKFRLDDY